jgi:hypothetical protein
MNVQTLNTLGTWYDSNNRKHEASGPSHSVGANVKINNCLVLKMTEKRAVFHGNSAYYIGITILDTVTNQKYWLKSSAKWAFALYQSKSKESRISCSTIVSGSTADGNLIFCKCPKAVVVVSMPT